MGIFKSICDFASSALSKAKTVVRNAAAWMVEKAERFVGKVKSVYRDVKPYVEGVQYVSKVAKHIPVPWLQPAAALLDKTIENLLALERSPVLRLLDAALRWAAERVRKWQGIEKEHAKNEQGRELLVAEDLTVARRHQETLHLVEVESVLESQRSQVELAAAVTDFEVAKADLEETIQSTPKDFEHYLRLRATQKLIGMADGRFRKARSVEDLRTDDLFLARIASDLIKAKPELNARAAKRLDRLLAEQYGKSLLPFVFEELVAAWAKRAEVMSAKWEAATRSYAKDSMLLKRLSLAKKIQGDLSTEEAAELVRLDAEVPAQKQALDALAAHQRDVERYVGAAEGFLQLLEKTPEEIREGERAYLLDDAERVAGLLVDCAEREKAFDSLSSADQALITDYANIFKRESQVRMKALLEVKV